MRVRNNQLGGFDVAETEILHLPGGLVGFEGHDRFAVHRAEEYDPFHWIVSITDPDLCFAVADPAYFLSEPYHLVLGDADRCLLDLHDDDPITVWLIVSMAGDGGRPTANLKGPIVVNERTRRAKQLLLYSRRFTARQPMRPCRDRFPIPRFTKIQAVVRTAGRKAA